MKILTGFSYFGSVAIVSASYANADTQKESILNDNKSKAGIYCWTHVDSGKKYVGSSIDLYRRFMQYYNIKYITRAVKSSLICRALLKYGYSKFQLEILEYCDPSSIIEREQYYIDSLKPEYNILQVAGSLFGYKHTPESLEKMREIALNRSDETKAKLREAALGKTYNHTEETKIKLRDAILGRKHSEETKAKLSLIQSNRIKHPVAGFKIEVKDMQTGQISHYDSIRDAGKGLNSNHASIRYNLDNGKLFRGRYLISKKNN
uniref:GIY-YIG endonuclease n=1 Tax=Orbilia oligospora TaxID=2813651 RepID=A0A6G6A570_ORBOL|nr:GIY-YIG endonuclease [Orbilia oligospora]